MVVFEWVSKAAEVVEETQACTTLAQDSGAPYAQQIARNADSPCSPEQGWVSSKLSEHLQWVENCLAMYTARLSGPGPGKHLWAFVTEPGV